MNDKLIKRFLILIPCLVILFFAQTSFLPYINIFGFYFDFFLLFIFIVVFFNVYGFAMLISVLGGLILDLFSFYAFGSFTLSLVLTCFLIKKLSKIFKSSNFIIFLILLIIYFIIFNIFLFAFNLILGKI